MSRRARFASSGQARGLQLRRGGDERRDDQPDGRFQVELSGLFRPGRRNGAVMLMDYTTGEILCMVSSPGDDLKTPAPLLLRGTYLNKCLSSSFTPGSVFKLVTFCCGDRQHTGPFESAVCSVRAA